MSAKATPQQSTEQTHDTEVDQSSTSGQTTGSGPGVGAPPAAPKGGGNYEIKRGDSLWKIAKDTYGSGGYWRQIRDANPETVFNGGDLILIGNILQLPVIQIVEESSEEGGEGPDQETPDGGVCDAREPVGICTDYGNFMVYPDDYGGELGPSTDDSEHVRESDYNRIIAEREQAANAQMERSISDIGELLSYGAFDWAITDAEASEALGLLGGLPMPQLKTALGRINVSRLLDNLPGSARRTQAFTRVVVALGPSGAQAFIQEILSYSLFDWAVTDGEIGQIVEIINTLPETQRVSVITQLDITVQRRFISNLPGRAGLSNEFLYMLFLALPASEIEALSTLMGIRFSFEVEAYGGVEWDKPAMQRLWEILEQLPPGHVEDNELLDIFAREAGNDGSGYYRGSTDAAVVSYNDIGKSGGYGNYWGEDENGNPEFVNAESNLFSTVVRHEIGHAVDAKIKASDTYAKKQAHAGKWEEYNSAAAFADAIIAAGGGMSGHGYPDEDAYEEALREAVDSGRSFNDALIELRESMFSSVPEATPLAAANVGGPVSAVKEAKYWMEDKSPWYTSHNRAAVGGRLFQESYSGSYVSFLKQSMVRNGVSKYQWRAPGEWFAEAYAKYYSDQDGPGGATVGTQLRARDSATADWFDTTVDQGHSLPAETGQATGGGTSNSGPAADG